MKILFLLSKGLENFVKLYRIALSSLRKTIFEKLVRPFLLAEVAFKELVWGATLGMFWTMTPLVGIQMSLVFINWFIFRLFKFHFHLPCALALVWISNPLTMGPLYFFFYLCGYFALNLFLEMPLELLSWQTFEKTLNIALSMELWSGLVYLAQNTYEQLFFPMFLGSLIISIPLSIATYFVSYRLLEKYKKKKK